MERIRHAGAIIIGLEGSTEKEKEEFKRGIEDGSIPVQVSGTVDGFGPARAAKGAVMLVKSSKGVWKWVVNGRVTSKATLKRWGLLNPKTTTTAGKPFVGGALEQTASGVPKCNRTDDLLGKGQIHSRKWKSVIRKLI